MFIEQITLQNIKSYGSTPTTIYFKEGINLIAGSNGAGKSTILEAIGFVLFGALPYTQTDFARRGKNGASKITIRLHSTYDNRVYDVERVVPGRCQVIDVQDHVDVGVGSVDDLMAWLCQHLKAEDNKDLEALFENAVGVQQGTITSVFLSTPASRKETFDALLRVHDFKRASDQLNATKKYITDLLTDNAKLIAKKEGQTERLPGLEADVKADHEAIAEKEEKLTGVSAALDALKSTLEQLGEQKKQLDELHRQIDQLDSKIERLKGSADGAEAEYDKSQEAHDVITTNAEAHRLYQEAVGRLKSLEEQRKERDDLLEKKREVEKQIASIELQINQFEAELAKVAKAEAQLTELAPQVDRQEKLDSELLDAVEHQKERDRLQNKLNTDIEQRVKLAAELEDLREQVDQRQQVAGQVDSISTERDQLTTQIDAFTEKLSDLKAAVESAQQAFNDASTQFEQYQNLQQSIEQKQTELEKAEADRVRIESDLAKREELDAQISDIYTEITKANGEKATAENNLPRINRELAELEQMREMVSEEGAVCPVCRRDMDGQAHDEALSYYDEQERKLHAERDDSQAQIEQLSASLEGWEAEKTSLEKERDGLANQAGLKAKQDQIAASKGEIAGSQASLADLAGVPEAYANAETALNDARTALDDYNSEIDTLKSERTDKIDAISKLNAQVATLPSPDELKRREGEYETLDKSIVQTESRLNELVDIDSEVQRVESELNELGNPREKQAVARSTAEKRPSLEENLQKAQDELATRQSELEAVQEELQPFDNLNADLEATRNQRDNTADGYQLYIENKAIADLLEEREERLNNLRDELANATDDHGKLTLQQSELAQGFDAEQYETLSQERTELSEEKTRLATQIEELSKQIAETETEIDNLRSIVAEIAELQIIAERIQEEQQTFEFVRRSIRDAGPRIRKRKVQFVSEVAANYFSEIINDFTMRLEWNPDDYGIYIEQTGEMRPFNVLSGGEQMIAALSVRLALLTHMTRIRLIFLDEPTINLDENRRIQLAERLNQIDGLQQLFVISHDDTFISGSNHIINVIKENGTSRVETGHAAVY